MRSTGEAAAWGRRAGLSKGMGAERQGLWQTAAVLLPPSLARPWDLCVKAGGLRATQEPRVLTLCTQIC